MRSNKIRWNPSRAWTHIRKCQSWIEELKRGIEITDFRNFKFVIVTKQISKLNKRPTRWHSQPSESRKFFCASSSCERHYRTRAKRGPLFHCQHRRHSAASNRPETNNDTINGSARQGGSWQSRSISFLNNIYGCPAKQALLFQKRNLISHLSGQSPKRRHYWTIQSRFLLFFSTSRGHLR